MSHVYPAWGSKEFSALNDLLEQSRIVLREAEKDMNDRGNKLEVTQVEVKTNMADIQPGIIEFKLQLNWSVWNDQIQNEIRDVVLDEVRKEVRAQAKGIRKKVADMITKNSDKFIDAAVVTNLMMGGKG